MTGVRGEAMVRAISTPGVTIVDEIARGLHFFVRFHQTDRDAPSRAIDFHAA